MRLKSYRYPGAVCPKSLGTVTLPSAAWEMREASGMAADLIGGKHLTDYNTVTSSTGLVNATARDFERDNNERLERINESIFNPGDTNFSFEVWVKLESTTPDYPQVFTKGGVSPNRGYGLGISSGTPKHFGFVVSADGTNAAEATDTDNISTGVWYHVICKHDATNNQISIRVNNGTPVTASHSGGAYTNIAPFIIGTYYGGETDGNGLFDGLIGPLRFWSGYLLTTTEEDALWNDGAGLRLSVGNLCGAIETRRTMENSSTTPFLSGWFHRKPLYYKLRPLSDQTDFPQLITISGDSDIATELASGGGITVTNADGETEIPFGLYPSSDPTSGDLLLRAKFSLDTDAEYGDILGFIYYDADETTVEDVAGVVDNGYVLFAPLAEDPSGSAPQMRNWVTNTLTGTSSGSMTSGDLVAAQVGDGIDFDGSDDAITFDSTVTSLLGEATASVLYNLTSGANRGPLIKQGVGGLTNISLQAFSSPDGIQFGWGSYGVSNFDSAWVTAGWHRVDFVRSGSSGSWAYALYLDGVLKSSGSGITDNPWGSGTTGGGLGGNHNDGNLVGVLNEAQLSDVARSADWLYYSYKNDFSNDNTFILGEEELALWARFTKRKEIRYGTVKPSSDLTDFPKLLVISGDSDIAAELASGGGIAISLADGQTEIPFGLYPSSDPTSGDLILRAKFDLDSSASTGDVIGYIYYDSSQTTTEDKVGTVNSGYVMFTPLEEDPSSSAPQILDWVTDTLRGTSAGSMTSADLVTGKVGSGIDFDGSNDKITFTGVTEPGSGSYTIEFWLNNDDWNRAVTGIFGSKFLTSSGQPGWYFGHWTTETWFEFSDGTTVSSVGPTAGTPVNDVWTHIVGVIDRGSNLARYYWNGTQVDTQDITGLGSLSSGQPILIGWQQDLGSVVDGIADELRISSVARSADWIAYAYADDSNNSNTFTLGDEEDSQGGSSTTSVYSQSLCVWNDLYRISENSGITWNENYTLYDRDQSSWNDLIKIEGNNVKSTWNDLQRVIGGTGGDQSTLLDDLISHWSLDETSGDAIDAHGSNDLTLTGTVGSATGKVGNARDFESGISGTLTKSSNTDLQCGDIAFTLAAWVKLETKTDNMIIVGKDINTTGNREYNILYRSATDRFSFELFEATDSGTILSADSSLGSPSVDVWYYIVAWYDPDANTMNIQVNNGPIDSVSKNTLQAAGTAPFHIGSRAYSGIESPFDGLIDEVSLWKRILTTDEKTDLYNSGSGLAYPFGESAEKLHYSSTWDDALSLSTLTDSDLLSWNINYAINDRDIQTWNDFSRIGGNQSNTWNNSQRVVDANSSSWNENYSLNNIKQETWNDLSRIKSNNQNTWNDLGRVSSTKSSTWNELFNINNNKQINWNEVYILYNNSNCTWNDFIAGLASVYSNYLCTWNDLYRITDSDQTTWNNLYLITNRKTNSWNNLVRISREDLSTWNDTQRIYDSNTSTWNNLVNLTIFDQDFFTWNVLKRIGDNLESTWNDTSRLSAETELTWNDRARLINSNQLNYNDLYRLVQNNQSTWGINKLVLPNYSIKYNDLIVVDTNTVKVNWKDVLRLTSLIQKTWNLSASVNVNTKIDWDIFGELLDTLRLIEDVNLRNSIIESLFLNNEIL